jgi:hypothetical protein
MPDIALNGTYIGGGGASGGVSNNTSTGGNGGYGGGGGGGAGRKINTISDTTSYGRGGVSDTTYTSITYGNNLSWTYPASVTTNRTIGGADCGAGGCAGGGGRGGAGGSGVVLIYWRTVQ